MVNNVSIRHSGVMCCRMFITRAYDIAGVLFDCPSARLAEMYRR